MSDADWPEERDVLDQRRKLTRRDVLKLGGAVGLAGLSAPFLSSGIEEAFADVPSEITRSSENLRGELTVWTYFDQVKIAAQQFEKKHSGVRVNVQVFPGSDYQTKMGLSLQSDVDAPDLFDLDAGYIGKYINGPFPEDLSSMGAAHLVKDYVPYVAALAKDRHGIIRGVTDTSSPGGYWIRRDVAHKYMGTGDPAAVSKEVDTFGGVIKWGKKVVQESQGSVHFLDSYDDIIMDARHQMQPWALHGAFHIDPRWNHVLDVARTVYNDNLDAKLGAFSPAWGSAWNDGSVIAFGWPAWASFEIDPKKTGNHWGVAQCPTPYYEGGRYTCIYRRSGKKRLAFEYLKFLASPEWQVFNLRKTQNMPGLKSVYQQLMHKYRPALFGHQPILTPYYRIAMHIPARPSDFYTEDIQGKFYGVVGDAFKAKQSNAQIWATLKSEVQQLFPNLRMP